MKKRILAGVLALGTALLSLTFAQAGTVHAAGQDNGSAGRGTPGVASDPMRAAVALPPGYTINGRDVSSNDHTNGVPPNWPAQKAAGDEFAFVKATEGVTYTNPYFNQDYNGAKAAGLYVGAYAFGRPDKGNPAGQADYFVDRIQWANDGKTLPPFLDLEWPYPSLGLPACYGLSTGQMVSWISQFLSRVQTRIGRTPMIYTNVNWWNQCTASSSAFGNYPLDVSSCLSSPPAAPGWGTRWTFWQYDIPECGRGSRVDSNVFNGDLAALARLAGGSVTGSEDTAMRVDGDFNGDGRSDVVALYNYGSAHVKLWTFLSNGTGFGSHQIWWDSGVGTFDWDRIKLASGDFNADGRDDVGLLYKYDGVRTALFVAVSTGSGFVWPQNWWDSDLGNWDWDRTKLASGDFNADGRDDVGLLYNYDSARSAMFAALSTGGRFASPQNWWDSGVGNFEWSRIEVVAGDFTGDGRTDVGLLYAYDGARSVMFVAPSSGAGFGWPTGWWDSGDGAFDGNRAKLATGDFNADGRADFTELYNYDNAHVRFFTAISTGTAFVWPQQWYDSGAGNWDWTRTKLA